MIQETLQAIAEKLRELFGEQYHIYTDTVVQDLKESCLIIEIQKVEQEQQLGNRIMRAQSFCIRFFPKIKGSTMEEARVSETLLDGMDCITVSMGLIQASKMNVQKQEGELHFYVNYNLLLSKKEERGEDMGELQVST